MKPFKDIRRVSLRTKINGLVLLDILVVITLIMIIFSFMVIKIQFGEMGQRALSLAEVVADMPEIKDAFLTPRPSTIIQPLVEKIRKQTGAKFIVVGNMHLIRYSHPNPANIGKHMVGNDDQLVLHGHTSISQAVGTLGLSVRGKAPIFNSDHRQIGVVSVGFMVEEIWEDIAVYLAVIGGSGIIGLCVGLLGAYILSGHVRKQIFNMEPFEIAYLAQEQAAILESIREGVLAVDDNGKITACNQEAKRLLALETSSAVIGASVRDVVPDSMLPEFLLQGVSQVDQPMIIGHTLVIANTIPVFMKGQVIGGVATFRDKMQLDEIDARLADVGRYVDTLRSQRHEFMNKLHTISGLIKMQEYSEARQLIDHVNREQQSVLEFFMAHVRDSAVVGILIGKLHRASELGIKFLIDKRSFISEPCPHRELVVTVLGNAIENSFEALANWEVKTRCPVVTVYLYKEDGQLIIKVSDSGPGVAPELRDKIFKDGITTKGVGRGFGLALVSRQVALQAGKVKIESSDEGTVFEASLPI